MTSGYQGTSIAAVIARSFETWQAAVELPGEETGPPAERVAVMAVRVAESLADTPSALSPDRYRASAATPVPPATDQSGQAHRHPSALPGPSRHRSSSPSARGASYARKDCDRRRLDPRTPESREASP